MKLFNTLSGQLEEFKPLSAKEVRMYACGPTVYDFAHIGNFRTFVFEDLLRRFLEYKGFEVKHVMNVTDVDDKTIAGANANVGAGPCARPQEGQPQGVAPTRELTVDLLNHYTKKYLDAFNEDLKTLNILPPAQQPKATAEIPEMVKLISKLIEKKAAYVSDSSVYYRVESFTNYGKLSKKDLKQNIKGARVDVDEYEKEDGSDFALWKKAREGEPSWDSPWGKGRPGWHIECSAMSMKCLGETIDIHAGGEDLIFPHHENEIAQSEAATGKPFVKYWLHAKHLLVNGEKMSKSKGNFYTLRDLLAKGYDPMAIRYVLLATHYRSQLNFTLEGINAGREALKRIRDFWFERKNDSSQKGSGEAAKLLGETQHKFDSALAEDLNTSQALAAIFDLIKKVNLIPKDKIGKDENKKIISFFAKIDSVLGVFSSEMFGDEIPGEIKRFVKEREEARKSRDFKKADEIRAKIKDLGYVIEDNPKGVLVKKI